MPKPIVAVFSRNCRFAADLSYLLGHSHSVAACDTAAEVQECLERREATGLVADLTNTAGGHAEAKWLEDLHAAHRGLQMVMLTPIVCPEPLERVAATTGIVHLRGRVDVADIATVFSDELAGGDEEYDASNFGADSGMHSAGDRLPQCDAARGKRERVGNDTVEPEAVLDGITRRFETKTLRMKEMLGELEVAASHDVTILLIGETGSGKTYLSRLIHEVSPRRDEPFLTVACGALTEELIESELFGHVKGAFTGAHADKEGKFLAAGRGTLLLDEIDVLSPEQQVKLLRVIETGEFEPVGSNKTYKSQARLVVASNLDLQPLVEQGKFRPDLYYRLNMLKFDVLPLRDRRHDIAGLARRFVEQLAGKHNVTIDEIDQGLFDALMAYPWPGNVRELENVVQRAVIYCRDARLSAKHLPPHVLSGTAGPTNDPSVKLAGPAAEDDDKRSLERQIALTEREIIEQALFRNNYSRTNTAKDLGISRVTLYNKMKKYDVTVS